MKHPKANRPMIDYDLANIFEPTVLLGTIIGVYLNVTFPSYIIVLVLAITCIVSAGRSLMKAIEMHKKEKNGYEVVNVNIQGKN